uniref:Peptidase S1 domain-containing protein n=1 Tax=Panagrolaimus sp. ES5 TaxID=591445 RepID=A0AC34FQP2_9BILA
MNGRSLLLFFFFLIPLLSIFNVDAAGPGPVIVPNTSAPIPPGPPAPKDGGKKNIPFYLIPVLSPDGKTTETGECIGALISYSHILAPSSCLIMKNDKRPSGVFIDFRAEKLYPEDKNLFPISEFTFSKKIEYNDESKLAIITLHVPFLEQNALGIVPNVLALAKGKGNKPFHFERKAKSVDGVLTEGGVETALFGPESVLYSFSSAELTKQACEWIFKTAAVKCK